MSTEPSACTLPEWSLGPSPVASALEPLIWLVGLGVPSVNEFPFRQSFGPGNF